MKKKTLIDLFNESVARYGPNPFLWERDTEYRPTTYNEVNVLVHRLGAGFVALGVNKGDRVALLAEGSGTWMIGELAILFSGGVNVPLSVKLVEAFDLQFRLNHSESRFILVSGTQVSKIRAIRAQLETVEKVIIFGDVPGDLEKDEMELDTLFRMGDAWNADYPGELDRIAASVEGDDLANITYTSGTTADPKGVMLTHRNFTANVAQCLSVVQIPEYFRTLLILPLDHCFAHVTGLYFFMSVGGSLATVPVGKTFIESIRNIPMALKEFQPQALMTVPALAKTFKNSVEQSVQAKGPTAVKLFNLGMKVAMKYNREGWNKGTQGTWILYPLVKLFDALLFSKMRHALGGKLEFFVDGGAYLDIEMQKFWYAAGIPMFQGYGLSEATPVISCNMIENHKLGTSGQIVADLELVLRDPDGNPVGKGESGEITVRGENVMKGYWKNPEATARTIKEGWLYTGDLGSVDDAGFLSVFGRSKSLLIGSDGEKYSPEGIEETITTLYPIIEQIMLYNNQNPYTTALVVPSREKLRAAVPSIDTPEGQQQAIQLIYDVLNHFRKGGKYEGLFPERWLPSAFALLPESFNESNGMMNSTLKMVRSKIEKAYPDVLEHLLCAEGRKHLSEQNLQAVRQLFESK
jgi:long-chain acyl-CoA synthetase